MVDIDRDNVSVCVCGKVGGWVGVRYESACI